MGRLLLLLALWPAAVAFAEPAPLTLRALEAPKHSAFPTLLWFQFFNDTMQPEDLAVLFPKAQLLIDGKAFPSAGPPPEGAGGVASYESWEGCFDPRSFAPDLAPGNHKVTLRLGSVESEPLRVSWEKPTPSDAQNAAESMKDVERTANSLPQGLPRRCVELWFPEKDGGLQSEGQTRYYAVPLMKVVVSYDDRGGPGSPDNRVSGRVRVYREARITD